MGIKKWLLKINPQETFNVISSGIDKLAFTKEERADLNLKLSDKVAEFAEKSLGESTIRSKTRRLMAIGIVGNSILLTWILIAMSLLNKDIEPVMNILQSFKWGLVFITVVGFHFGTYLLAGSKFNKK